MRSEAITRNDLEEILNSIMPPRIKLGLIGEIRIYGGVTVPSGWRECNGGELAKADYPLLYEAIGDSWGTASDSDHFKLPDLKGRVPVGFNPSDTDFDTVGDDGGTKTHLHTTGNFTLGTNHIPAHTHGSKTITYKFHSRRQGTGSQSLWADSNVSVAATSTATTTTNAVGTKDKHADQVTLSASHTHDSVGGGSAHNHGNTGNGSSLQPYAVVKYIICAV
jgi:microcystin-dependent protein